MTPTLRELIKDAQKTALEFDGTVATTLKPEFRRLLGHIGAEVAFLSDTEREEVITEMYKIWETKE